MVTYCLNSKLSFIPETKYQIKLYSVSASFSAAFCCVFSGVLTGAGFFSTAFSELLIQSGVGGSTGSGGFLSVMAAL